jgi:hypothetical protein
VIVIFSTTRPCVLARVCRRKIWHLKSQKERSFRTNPMCLLRQLLDSCFVARNVCAGGPTGDGGLARLPKVQHGSGSRDRFWVLVTLACARVYLVGRPTKL